MEITVHATTNATTWMILATDGTGYVNKATLLAAGKIPFPGTQSVPQNTSVAPAGSTPVYPTAIEMSSLNGTGAGSGFFFNINPPDGFSALASDSVRDGVSDFNYASGQKEVAPGLNPPLGHWNYIEEVWLRKTVGADTPIFRAIY